MKILALEKPVPGAAADAFTPELLAAEAAQVWTLYQEGLLREIYFRKDRHEAVLILECADEVEARAALGALPLVQRRLIDFDVIPLTPYPGFARLFAAPG